MNLVFPQQQLGVAMAGAAGSLPSLPRRGPCSTLIMVIYIPATQKLSQLGKETFWNAFS